MADAAAVDEKTPVAPRASAFPIKLLIIVSVVALMFGVGGAFVAVKFLGGSGKGAEHSEENKAVAEVKAESKSEGGGKHGQAASPGAMFDLDPFIVNLADTPDVRYLKLTLKLEVDNETVAAELSSRIPQIRDAILVLLSSKDVNAVRTTQGKFQLRDEITQRINGLLKKPGIRSAYFTEFVVQ
ncbi:MAG: Flagellar basal body-associated protein FliL [Nitrospira sp.]|jgi:flagellar FliL protein|nr:MAG: Flagellar basal body-associated protein FliL [Nitrospira sp.]